MGTVARKLGKEDSWREREKEREIEREKDGGEVNLATRTQGSLLFFFAGKKKKRFPNFILSPYADCGRKKKRGWERGERREEMGGGAGTFLALL